MRLPGGGGFGDDDGPPRARTEGQNPPAGAVIYYHLKTAPDAKAPFSLEILDGKGNSIRKWTSTAERPPDKVEPKAGMNRFVWDLRYAEATKFPGMILWGGSTRGPVAVPGTYTVELAVDGHTETAKVVEALMKAVREISGE